MEFWSSLCSSQYRIFSTSNPNHHAGLKSTRIALRIETQPKRVAIVIADRALGLPGREGAERPELSDNGWCRPANACTRDLNGGPDRKAAEASPRAR
jgi:hypothetical protein